MGWLSLDARISFAFQQVFGSAGLLRFLDFSGLLRMMNLGFLFGWILVGLAGFESC
jgi:hypothetical protein